ncbi:MAG TPA: DUF6325 family protein [Solirubrobacteraceae bacterium]|jgi:hypothetical protein
MTIITNDEPEMGPVDMIVIGFPPDAPRTGEAIPLFLDLVDRGIVRVLDVLVVQRDDGGNVTRLEIDGLAGTVLASVAVFDGAQTGLLGDDDAAVAGEALEPGEAAVLICFENRWAAPFIAAVRRNGGRLLAAQRIGAQELLDTIQTLDAVA